MTFDAKVITVICDFRCNLHTIGNIIVPNMNALSNFKCIDSKVIADFLV